MKNKPGFKIKIDEETLLYIGIVVIILVFVLLMPNIYQFISDIKTGNVFKGNKTPVVENNNVDGNTNNQNNNQVEEPVSETTLACTLMDSKPEGNFTENYVFYFNSNKLNSIKNEKEYDAITDEYLNYVYSEQSKFNNMYELYKDTAGFSYNSTMENRMLEVTFIYDLNKLTLDSLKNEDENLSIDLDVTKDQNLEEIKGIYTSLGYTCN